MWTCDHGLPQKRERLYIIAVLREHLQPDVQLKSVFPEPLHEAGFGSVGLVTVPTLSQAQLELPGVQQSLPGSEEAVRRAGGEG